MFKGKTVLLQMQTLISGYDFKKIVSEYNGDKGTRVLKTRNLLSIMLYTHLSGKQSLRDLVDSFQSKRRNWYHLGIRSLSRNNVSYALQNRPHEIFERSFYLLLTKLQKERGLFQDRRFRFKMPLKTFDSTTISLCLSLFNWAHYRKRKGGIKLHTLFNNKDQLPEIINFSNAGKHDVTMADSFPIECNSIYTFDKGYICFEYLQKINKNKAFFVTRTKTNTQYRILERRKKTHKNVKADWIVRFSSYKSKDYPEKLRVVRFKNEDTGKVYEFMTNNFSLSAKTIADIYKARWDIELFFKWIKQNLKIKTFIGTSENAVRIQVWTAMIAYLMIQYIRFVSNTSFSILKSYRVIIENLLFSVDIYGLLVKKLPPPVQRNDDWGNQLRFAF